MKFRDLIKELDSSDNIDNLDLSNDGEVELIDDVYFENGFKDHFEIDYDKEGYPTVIHRRDLKNVTAKDLAIIKRWVEWHNKNSTSDVLVMATDVTRDLGVGLARK